MNRLEDVEIMHLSIGLKSMTLKDYYELEELIYASL